MKKIRKNLLLLILLTFFLTNLSACSTEDKNNYKIRNVITEIVERSDISNVLSFSSTIEGNKETILSAKAAGQILEIGVDIGDEVLNGELLASLTAEVDNANYNIAQISSASASRLLASAEDLLNQNIEEAKITIIGAEESFKQAENAEKDKINVLNEGLKNAELNYELAKINYENIKSTTTQEEQNILDSAESAIVQAAVLSKRALAYIYDINIKSFDAYDKNVVKNFYIYSGFSAKDSYVTEAEKSIGTLMESAVELEEYYNTYIKKQDPPEEIIKTGHELAKRTIEETKNAIQDLDSLISHSKSNSQVTDEMLKQYKDKLYTYASQAESLMLSSSNGVQEGLIGIDQSMSTLGINTETALSQAEKKIEIADQNIKTLKESLNATNNSLSSQTALMDIYLKQAMNGFKKAEAQKNNQMAVMQAQLDNAKSQVGLASAMLENTKIEAPYSGIISEKHLYEGTVVNAGTPVLTIADISKLKLVIFVPENQIKYLGIGQKGIATSDSFPGEKFKTNIERISPKVESGSRKVRVELSVEDEEKTLKIGMYMNLKLELESEEKILAIPIDSIQDFYGEKFVFINNGGKAEMRAIKTGITTSRYIEVLEGVEEGEELVIKGISKVREGDELKVVKIEEANFIQPIKTWIDKAKI